MWAQWTTLQVWRAYHFPKRLTGPWWTPFKVNNDVDTIVFIPTSDIG